MDQGGKIRTANMLRGMKGGVFQITLASPAPANHAVFQKDIEAACDRFVWWPAPRVSQTRRFVALASSLPVAVATDHSPEGRAVVRASLADRPDIVVADFPHADVLMPARINSASVMFTHNVEAEIFERHARRSNGMRRLVWTDQSRKMDQFESKALGRYDKVVAVSDRDRTALERRYRLSSVEAIDTGVDLDFFAATSPANAPGPRGGTLVFTATMSWAANVDGIHFLLDEVWPLLTKARPDIKAVIIGRDPPASLSDKVRQRDLNVVLTGFVDDIRPYVAAADVYVIPLFVGSGTRIKAFEAMAMNRPVVSTGLGVEGLDVRDGETYLRADDASTFTSAILRLLDDRALRERIAGTARQLVEARFSWSKIARQFEAICQDAMKPAQSG